MASVELYRRLRDDTGRDPGWREVGSLRLASSKERLLELKRQVGWARTFGLPLSLISPEEARDLFPMMSIAGVEGAAYLPTDGRIDPASLATALAAGARRRGVAIRTGVSVRGIAIERRRVAGVETDEGTVRCEVVVNAGGIWSHEIGRMVGLNVPVIPMAHQYLVTKPIAGVTRDIPTMRDPDRLVYFREEVGGLVMGGYERSPVPWGLDGIPRDFTHKLLAPDWERFDDLMALAVSRVPAIAGTPARRRSRRTPRATTSTVRARNGAPGGGSSSRRLIGASKLSARSSARRPAGSDRTGSRPTLRGRRGAGRRPPGSRDTGRRRSKPSTWRRASGRRSSTRPRSAN